MSPPGRYFENTLGDFVPSVKVAPDVSVLKDRILKLVDAMIAKFPPVPRNVVTEAKCDGGLYVGLAGMAFSLWHTANSGLFPEHNARLLQTAKAYIEIVLGKLSQKPSTIFDEVAFLLGNVGNYLTAALVYNSLGEKDKVSEMLSMMGRASKICEPINFHKHGSDELFVGRAGYLTAIQSVDRLLIEGHQKRSAIDGRTRQELCEAVLKSGLNSNSTFRKSGKTPLMYSYYGEEYLGMAHGIAGIQLALLNEQSVILNRESIQQLKKSIDFVLATQTPSGNFEPTTDELVRKRPEDHELVHWCHGAPGIIHLLAKAYLVFKDNTYLAGCQRAAELIWNRGLLKKGPGICHGIAGNGYAFLLMYRLTGDEKYYYRALQFAEFIFTSDFEMNSRVPDEPWSLFEGWAGAVCYFVDLLQPNKAEFPFAHVF